MRRVTNLGIAVFLCLLSTLLAAPADGGIEGHWKGAIQLPGAEMDFDIDFEGGASNWSGDISIPKQGARNLPLTSIRLEAASVSFAIDGVPGNPTFKGDLSGDEIKGDFTQGGQTFPFAMKRGRKAAAEARRALEGFDEFADKAMQDWQTVGLAIAVVTADEIAYAQGFGHRDLENRLPVTTDTLFAIGSSSKAFTTFAMGILVDQGKLTWDDPVVGFLPGWKLSDEVASNRIAPRDLVTHRTGLPRHDLVWYNNRELTRRQIFDRLRYLPPNRDLRQVFQYNNLMFVMAGYLVGQLEDTTWEEAVGSLILTPLGMSNTNFSVEDSQRSDDFALPYQVRKEQIERRAFRDISNVGPAGSINSSVNDMARWLRVHLGQGRFEGRQIVQETTLREMHTPQMAIASLSQDPKVSPMSYALGWMVNTYRGHYRVMHGGNIDGFSALVTLYPNDDLGIVVLTNQNGSAMPGLATNHATDRILGLDEHDWHGEAFARFKASRKAQEETRKEVDTIRVADTKPSHPLEDYVGDYAHPGYGTLSITSKGERLEMSYNGISTPLEHWHYDDFNGLENPDDRTFESMKLHFAVNMKGDVDSVSAPFEPTIDNVIFKKQAESNLKDPAYLARFEGGYQLSLQKAIVKLQGDHLTLTLPGQPTYHLDPYRNDEFNLRGLNGFSVKFEFEEEKEAAARAVFKQPNGVFTAVRLQE